MNPRPRKVWTVFTVSGRSYLVDALTADSAVRKAASAMAGYKVDGPLTWNDGRAEIQGYTFHRPVLEPEVY